MVLETKIWVLGVLVADGVSFLLAPLSWQRKKKMCVYTKPHVCVRVHARVCVYIYA